MSKATIYNADVAIVSLEAIHEYVDEMNAELGASFCQETYEHLVIVGGLIRAIKEQINHQQQEGGE